METANHKAANVIIVLGMHRSGTSVCAGILNLLGVDLGQNMLATQYDNPQGYFENSQIWRINENIFKSFHLTWDDATFLPEKWWESPCIAHLYQDALNVLSIEFVNSRLFAIKDPRLCRTLPFWQIVFNQFNIKQHYIIPLRHPLEIAHSLKTRNSFSTEKSLIIWMMYMLEAEYYTRDNARVFYSFDDLVNNANITMQRIFNTLNLKQPLEYEHINDKIDQYITPQEKHHSYFVESTQVDIINEFHTSLQNLSNESIDECSELLKIDKIRDQFYRLHRLFYNPELMPILSASSALKSRKYYKSYPHVFNLFLPLKSRRRRFVKSIISFFAK